MLGYFHRYGKPKRVSLLDFVKSIVAEECIYMDGDVSPMFLDLM